MIGRNSTVKDSVKADGFVWRMRDFCDSREESLEISKSDLHNFGLTFDVMKDSKGRPYMITLKYLEDKNESI